jgi:hypothetical protein
MGDIIRWIDHALTPLEHSARRVRRDCAEEQERLPTERERLLAARKAAFDAGCRLTRLVRDCDHEADKAFREAQRIGEQLAVLK